MKKLVIIPIIGTLIAFGAILSLNVYYEQNDIKSNVIPLQTESQAKSVGFYDPIEKCEEDGGEWMRAVCKLADDNEIDYDPDDTARVGNRVHNEYGQNVIAMELDKFEFEKIEITTGRSGYWEIILDQQDYLDHKDVILEIIGKEILIEEKDDKITLSWNEYTSNPST